MHEKHPTPDGAGMPDDGMDSPDLDVTIAESASVFVRDVVDRALQELGDEHDAELLRATLTETVVDTLRTIASDELARRSATAAGNGRAGAGNGGFAVGDAADRGIQVAKAVKDLGFVEFTTGLVTGVFDTLTASTLKQMEGYSKLVREVASSLSEFAAENVTAAEVDAHLAVKYPDGAGGTVVRPDYTFKATAEDEEGNPGKSANEKLREVARSLVLATGDLPESKRLNEADLGLDDDQVVFSVDQLRAIRKSIAFLLAFDMRNVLHEMVREGMARIVVTDGELLTKLTFNVSSTEIAAKQQAQYHQDSAGAYIHGQAGIWWGSARAGGSWNQLNVNTVNEQSFDSLTMSAEMIGQVKIRFKTETFPPRDISLPSET
jgi:hypothetical protein